MVLESIGAANRERIRMINVKFMMLFCILCDTIPISFILNYITTLTPDSLLY